MKNLIIAVLLANLGFAYWIIHNNIKAMRKLQKASEEVKSTVDSLEVGELKRQLKEEIRKQYWNVTFLRFR